MELYSNICNNMTAARDDHSRLFSCKERAARLLRIGRGRDGMRKRRFAAVSLMVILLIGQIVMLPAAGSIKVHGSREFTVERVIPCNISGKLEEANIYVPLDINRFTDGVPIYYRIEEYGIYPKPTAVITDAMGNLCAYYHLKNPKSFEVRQITRFELLDAELLPEKKYSAAVKEEYTRPSKGIESDDPGIMAKARALTTGAGDPYEKVQAVYQFVQEYMTYEEGPYANRGALSAFTNRKGVCEDYADLMAALLRDAGVPARVAYGYGIDPAEFGEDVEPSVKTSDGGLWLIHGDEILDGHAWVEYYLEGEGWIGADPTAVWGGNTYKEVNWEAMNYMSKGSLYINECYYNPAGVGWSYNASEDIQDPVDIGNGSKSIHTGFNRIPENYFRIQTGHIKAADTIGIKVNGRILNAKVPPILEKGRVLVPLRTVAEALGVQVSWDADKNAALMQRGDDRISVRLGATAALVNEQERVLDTPPILYDGKLMVPLRFAAESLGASVIWDSQEKNVLIGNGKPADLQVPGEEYRVQQDPGLFLTVDQFYERYGDKEISKAEFIENWTAH